MQRKKSSRKPASVREKKQRELAISQVKLTASGAPAAGKTVLINYLAGHLVQSGLVGSVDDIVDGDGHSLNLTIPGGGVGLFERIQEAAAATEVFNQRSVDAGRALGQAARALRMAAEIFGRDQPDGELAAFFERRAEQALEIAGCAAQTIDEDMPF